MKSDCCWCCCFSICSNNSVTVILNAEQRFLSTDFSMFHLLPGCNQALENSILPTHVSFYHPCHWANAVPFGQVMFLMSIALWSCLWFLFFFLILFYLTLQYCIGFAIYKNESATGIHVFPILNPPSSSLPRPSLWVVPVHQPQASSIVHRTWTGDLFHIWYYTYFNAIFPNHPTLSLSHRVQKTLLHISVSFAVSYTGLLLWSF